MTPTPYACSAPDNAVDRKYIDGLHYQVCVRYFHFLHAKHQYTKETAMQ